MNYNLTDSKSFPLVEFTLRKDETIQIQRGSMVYHDGNVSLKGKTNSNSSGVGGFIKAAARSAVSGESVFMTHATGLVDGAKIAIAPCAPGNVKEIDIGKEQWLLNDHAFLACSANARYEMKRQTLGKALFAGTGGLFIMKTQGEGQMLVSSFGDIIEMKLDGTKKFVVDNSAVVAWSASLDFKIEVASGVFGFTTGEGLVNEFSGVGTVFIQTRSLQALAESIGKYLPTK